jgi:hypothetical protein
VTDGTANGNRHFMFIWTYRASLQQFSNNNFKKKLQCLPQPPPVLGVPSLNATETITALSSDFFGQI